MCLPCINICLESVCSHEIMSRRCKGVLFTAFAFMFCSLQGVFDAFRSIKGSTSLDRSRWGGRTWRAFKKVTNTWRLRSLCLCVKKTCVRVWSHLYPAETSLDLQLLHQLPGLADAHGAVHWGVSFHPSHRDINIYALKRKRCIKFVSFFLLAYNMPSFIH